MPSGTLFPPSKSELQDLDGVKHNKPAVSDSFSDYNWIFIVLFVLCIILNFNIFIAKIQLE